MACLTGVPNFSILAIDQGTKLGWAYLCDREIQSGVENFSIKKDDDPGKRWVMFRKWIQDYKDIDLIVSEKTFIRFAAATKVAHGFITRIEEYATHVGAQHKEVQATTLKKFATGSGKAKKPEMIAAAKRYFPRIDIIDDNHADALHLLRYALEKLV